MYGPRDWGDQEWSPSHCTTPEGPSPDGPELARHIRTSPACEDTGPPGGKSHLKLAVLPVAREASSLPRVTTGPHTPEGRIKGQVARARSHRSHRSLDQFQERHPNRRLGL